MTYYFLKLFPSKYLLTVAHFCFCVVLNRQRRNSDIILEEWDQWKFSLHPTIIQVYQWRRKIEHDI